MKISYKISDDDFYSLRDSVGLKNVSTTELAIALDLSLIHILQYRGRLHRLRPDPDPVGAGQRNAGRQ